MKVLLVGVFIFGLLSVCCGQDSGTCESWIGTPDTCVGVINYEVFVQDGETQESNAGEHSGSLDFADALSEDVNLDCKTDAKKVFCGLSFFGCHTENITVNSTTEEEVEFPQLICKNVCEDFKSNCKTLFQATSSSQESYDSVDCEDTIVINNEEVPLFPEKSEGTTFTYGNVTITVPCLDPGLASTLSSWMTLLSFLF
eukprot:TRINITY_DN6315_c0_g1_i2.p2 TRINITY_DN6315_c0_g1~~TRINITY_DN6315_c0_g1_i2.p2  ORF type:complete len:199 (-),score=31.62 TRINITY_DN6315_c0_g1_i2:45-641(-)